MDETGSLGNKVMKEVKLFSGKDVDQAIEEVSALSRCKHENIIRYYEAFVDKDTVVLSIVMEYATEGDLDKQIKERKGEHFPNDVIWNWFTQLLSALVYIHKRGILHRDIKPQNIFVDKNYVLKLGDFGICRILQREADLALTMIGTPFYLSPEICLQQPYNCKSDMWSAGCVLYELCCLRVPFTANNIPCLTAKIIAGVYNPLPNHCDRRSSNAVQSLLVADPEKRLSAAELLQLADCTIREDIVTRPLTPVLEEFTPRARKRQAGTPIKLDDEATEWSKKERRGLQPFKLASPRQGIDNTTYTIVRYPKLRHLSPASPELSQLLERQRSMSSPRDGYSAAGPEGLSQPRIQQRRQKQQDVCIPRLNLLHVVKELTPQSSKDITLENNAPFKKIEMDLDQLEQIMDSVIGFNKSSSSSQRANVVENIKRQILALIEPRRLALVLEANRGGTKYSLSRQKFCLGPNIAQGVLWYVKLQEFL